MIIGYARVSTADQSLERQIDALKAAGCTEQFIYTEKMSGTRSDRPEFSAMMKALREGDTLIIESLSRLSRTTKDILATVEELSKRGVNIISLKERFDTTTPTGRAQLGMFSIVAQLERDLISERTKEGLKSARIRGRQGGRPKKGTDQEKAEAMALYNANAATNGQIAARYKISKSTLSKWIREYKAAQRKEGSSSGG